MALAIVRGEEGDAVVGASRQTPFGASIMVVIWKKFAGNNDLRRLRLRDAETLIHAPVLRALGAKAA
jgi:hypothetical protein